MKITHTNIQGCFEMIPDVHSDKRGYFMELYQQAVIDKELNQTVQFVQDNLSKSGKNVLRGLHFQSGEYAQAKLVKVLKGAVTDVVVDIRPQSPTYGLHYRTLLSDQNHKMLFIPKGLAHGFLSLENDTLFMYKCDAFYHQASESGIRFDDPELGIDWGIPPSEIILSEKDEGLPLFKNLRE